MNLTRTKAFDLSVLLGILALIYECVLPIACNGGR
jgi:hypothetical protein